MNHFTDVTPEKDKPKRDAEKKQWLKHQKKADNRAKGQEMARSKYKEGWYKKKDVYEEAEQVDEAAKDRPFTKWAAKALYGKKGSSNLKKGACVTCGSTDQQFRDALSKKEWGISGMCQNCQDKVFSK